MSGSLHVVAPNKKPKAPDVTLMAQVPGLKPVRT